jgi:hypothetical protein
MIKFKLPKKFRTSGLTVLENGRLHAVRYIFEEGLTIKELENKGVIRLKSGISQRLNKKEYLSELVRGDSTGKKMIWWDDNFIDQFLTFEQASEVITKMDKIFNTMMRDNGYNVRKIYRTKRVGTEWFESDDKQSLIDTIKYTWDLAYRLAYSFVTKTEAPNAEVITPFVHRPLQDTLITVPSIEGFRLVDRMTWEIPGGSGKSKCSMYVSQQVCKELGLPWKVLGVAPDRAMAAQLCDEFSKFYRGQKDERLMNLYIIGSLDAGDWRAISAWANIIQVSNKLELKKMLLDVTSSNEDCGVFVVNKSVGEFLAYAKEIKVDFKEFFTIIDEIHNYAIELGKPTTVDSPRCAIYNPTFNDLFGKRLGLSATHINRDELLVPFTEHPDAIFNDDMDKNGPCWVRITETEARSYYWVCDKQGVLIDVPTDQVFVDALANKNSFVFSVEGNPFKFHPVTFVGVEGIRTLAPTHNKIIALCSYRADVGEICRLLREYQLVGLLDDDFVILEGYVENSTQLIAKFNEQGKRVILVATRWIGVGNDTYTCDCTIPLYNPKSRAYARQFGMRGDRVYIDPITGEEKVTTFAMVIHQDQLEDSPFYETLQMISNGEDLQIVSEAEFRQNRKRTTGGRVTGNITMVQGERSNRETSNEVSVMLQKIMSLVAKREYIDEATGKTHFSEIAGLNIKFYTYDMVANFIREYGFTKKVEFQLHPEGNKYYLGAKRCGFLDDIVKEFNLQFNYFYEREDWDNMIKHYNLTPDNTVQEVKEAARDLFGKVAIITKARKLGWMKKGDFKYAKRETIELTPDEVIQYITENGLVGKKKNSLDYVTGRNITKKNNKSYINWSFSKVLKAYNKFVEEGQIEELLINNAGRPSKIKGVKQFDLKGKFIAFFNTVAEAARSVGVDSAGINHVCKGTQNKAAGFIWKYADEDNTNFKLNN